MFRINGIKPENQGAETTVAQEEKGKEKETSLAKQPQAEKGMERRIAEVEAQRKAFEEKNPDFDMKKEMENNDFVKYLWGNNLSVEDAYLLTHRNEILAQVRQEAFQEAAKRRERISENGAGKNQPAIAAKNPKDLSDKEIDSIIERVRNGEKITF